MFSTNNHIDYRPPAEGGTIGPAGEDGLSAYEVAVANGYTGTESEWLESLKGGETWIDYTLRGEYISSIAIAGGDRLLYVYETVNIYRFVPTVYVYANDAFYSDIDLTILLARRE